MAKPIKPPRDWPKPDPAPPAPREPAAMLGIRTRREVEQEYEKAKELSDDEETLLETGTYEDGVEAAFKWLLGKTDDAPITSLEK